MSFERSPFTPEAHAHERMSSHEPDSTSLEDDEEVERHAHAFVNKELTLSLERTNTHHGTTSLEQLRQLAATAKDGSPSTIQTQDRQLVPSTPRALSLTGQDDSTDSDLQDLSTLFQQGLVLKRNDPNEPVSSPFSSLAFSTTTSANASPFDGLRPAKSPDSQISSSTSDLDDRKPAANPRRRKHPIRNHASTALNHSNSTHPLRRNGTVHKPFHKVEKPSPTMKERILPTVMNPELVSHTINLLIVNVFCKMRCDQHPPPIGLNSLPVNSLKVNHLETIPLRLRCMISLKTLHPCVQLLTMRTMNCQTMVTSLRWVLVFTRRILRRVYKREKLKPHD